MLYPISLSLWSILLPNSSEITLGSSLSTSLFFEYDSLCSHSFVAVQFVFLYHFQALSWFLDFCPLLLEASFVFHFVFDLHLPLLISRASHSFHSSWKLPNWVLRIQPQTTRLKKQKQITELKMTRYHLTRSCYRCEPDFTFKEQTKHGTRLRESFNR